MIDYKIGFIPETEQICTAYDSSGINRPTSDKSRIKEMYANSDLIVSAWKGDVLIGIARTITDYCYVAYLSDLAVIKEFQHQGIGKELVEKTRKELGEKVTLILLSAPSALEYYPKIGFEKFDACFLIHRKKTNE
jgi:predicted N-acetyltransferase YhbS